MSSVDNESQFGFCRGWGGLRFVSRDRGVKVPFAVRWTNIISSNYMNVTQKE